MYKYDLKTKELTTDFSDGKEGILVADFISDLHLDFYINEMYSLEDFINKMLSEISQKAGDVLIVGGDISHKNDLSYCFLERVSKIWEDVLVIPGNHEWYLQKKDEDRYSELVESMEDFSNIHFLMDKVEIFEKNGVKFAGAMMMYNLQDSLDFLQWRGIMNDAKFISRDFANKRNSKEVAYYKKVCSQIDVFVSHVPIVNLDGSYAKRNLFWNTDVYPEEKVLHIAGHTHDKKDNVDCVDPISTSFPSINVSFGYPSESESRNVITRVHFDEH